MFLMGLKTSIEKAFPDSQVVPFLKPDDLIEQSKTKQPSLIIADLMLGNRKTGLELILTIKEIHQDLKAILISSTQEDRIRDVCQENGIQGYIFKSESVNDIIKAIETVLQGNIYYSREIPSDEVSVIPIKDKVNPFSKLTRRELEVVTCLAKGMSYSEIAKSMNISPRTVNNHRVNITEKIGKLSLSHLIMKARIWGVVDESNVYSNLESKREQDFNEENQ